MSVPNPQKFKVDYADKPADYQNRIKTRVLLFFLTASIPLRLRESSQSAQSATKCAKIVDQRKLFVIVNVKFNHAEKRIETQLEDLKVA